MTELVNAIWDVLGDAVIQAKKKDERVDLNLNAKKEFRKLFEEKYNLIKNSFMKKEVNYLDRHKVASIIIASALESNAIVYSGNIIGDKKFLGKYFIAVAAGMSYMQDRLNEKLHEKGEKEIAKYWYPSAFSCNTPFFAIFSRNLYFTSEMTDWKLNILDMSEIMFLIEYMTLEKNCINPNILKGDS